MLSYLSPGRTIQSQILMTVVNKVQFVACNTSNSFQLAAHIIISHHVPLILLHLLCNKRLISDEKLITRKMSIALVLIGVIIPASFTIQVRSYVSIFTDRKGR